MFTITTVIDGQVAALKRYEVRWPARFIWDKGEKVGILFDSIDDAVTFWLRNKSEIKINGDVVINSVNIQEVRVLEKISDSGEDDD